MLAFPQNAPALTPNSPEVQKLIKAGLKFLESTHNDFRLGGKCLVGLALLKNGAGADHPRIVEAVKACQAAAGQNSRDGRIIYSYGLAVIFLCELDANRYHTQIESFLEALRNLQKDHGGWGYPDRKTGDTSMTQYAVLSMWEAKRAGFNVPLEPIEHVVNWLLRTQDPSGGWGYQGKDPGNFELVKQDQVTRARTAAGLGSLMISASMLGMVNLDTGPTEEEVPSVLSLVQNRQEATPLGVLAKEVSRARVHTAIQHGSEWIQKNYQIDDNSDIWVHYYLYALERYLSILESADRGYHREELPWYDYGYHYLKSTWTEKAGWQGKAGNPVDTAFAVLFLSRSMRKSLEGVRQYGNGMLIGGRGLPRNVVGAEFRHGKFVSKDSSEKRIDLIKVLSDPDNPDYEYLIENPDQVVVDRDEATQADEIGRLGELIHNGQPEVRIVAVRALARMRNLDHVPTLLYAMTDPDWRVVREACDGLRFTSRKFDGFELPLKRNNDARDKIIAKWRKWYLTIRPDAEFED